MRTLPFRLSRLIGRDKDLETVTELTREHRVVTLIGVGGCGKTRLAVELGTRWRAAGDEVHWIDLARLTRGQSVSDAMASALGAAVLQIDPLDAICESLKNRAALLIFDNCEHVIEACCHVIEQVLDRCGGVLVLATSRVALEVEGETLWRVLPLSVPDSAALHKFEAVHSSDAVQLFVERTTALDPSFRLDELNSEVVGKICRTLDGIPLALELAAGLTIGLPLSEIEGTLRSDIAAVDTGASERNDYRRTLRASIEWSHRLLEPVERVVFRRLAVFAGGFSLDAAREVCGHRGLLGKDVALALVSLVKKSLVALQPVGASHRYRLLEMTRQYAEARLSEAVEEAEFRCRQFEYFTALFCRWENEAYTADSRNLLDRFDEERQNARAALDYAIVRRRKSRQILRLASGLCFFFNVRVDVYEGRRWFSDALEATDNAPCPERARVLWGSSFLAFNAGDAETARQHAKLALDMARGVGDIEVASRALGVLGCVEAVRHPVLSRAHLLESADLARTAGDVWGLAHSLGFIARSWMPCDIDEARKWCAAERDSLRQISSTFLLTFHWIRIAGIELFNGRLSEAMRAVDSAQRLASEIGNPLCEVFAAKYGCEVLCRTGQEERAFEYLEAMRSRLYLVACSPVVRLFLEEMSGCLALSRGQLEKAMDSLIEAERLATETGYLPIRVACLLELADTLLLKSEDEAAALKIALALELASTIGDVYLTTRAMSLQACLLAAHGDDKAYALCREALSLQRDRGYMLEQLSTMAIIVDVLIARGRVEAAAHLLGAIDANCEKLGVGRRFEERHRRAQSMGRLSKIMAAEKLQLSMHAGAHLDIARATEYALRGPGKRQRRTSGWTALTDTERAVVRLVAQGLTTPEIARQMLVSPGTVKTHLAHIFDKLGISRRSELAAKAALHLPL